MLKRNTRFTIFAIIIFFVIGIFFFVAAEIAVRMVIGERLIVDVQENGLNPFRPNQHGWYSLKAPRATINNIGARGDSVDLSAKEVKFLFLGDSFTFGWQLEDHQTIPYYFTKAANLPSSAVWNYAIGGYGLDHMIATYRTHKQKLKQNDTVVLVLIEDDIDRQMTLRAPSAIRDFSWRIRANSAFVAWILTSAKDVYMSISPRAETRPEISLDKFEEKLVSFRSEVSADGQKIVYVFYEYMQTDFSRRAEEICNRNNFVCVTDMWKILLPLPDDEKYSKDGWHPSALSNRRVADFLVEKIHIQ